jgi:septal ring factor EnvC (AmiA/AmiB activator)
MEKLIVHLRSQRDNLRGELASKEKEQTKKNTASDKRLQQIISGHQKTLEKLMDENKALPSNKQTLRREVKDAKNSQAFAEAQATEARNKIADVRRAITAKAAQAYLKRKKEDGHRVPALPFETQGGGAAADQSSGANRRPRSRSK